MTSVRRLPVSADREGTGSHPPILTRKELRNESSVPPWDRPGAEAEGNGRCGAQRAGETPEQEPLKPGRSTSTGSDHAGRGGLCVRHAWAAVLAGRGLCPGHPWDPARVSQFTTKKRSSFAANREEKEPTTLTHTGVLLQDKGQPQGKPFWSLSHRGEEMANQIPSPRGSSFVLCQRTLQRANAFYTASCSPALSQSLVPCDSAICLQEQPLTWRIR